MGDTTPHYVYNQQDYEPHYLKNPDDIIEASYYQNFFTNLDSIKNHWKNWQGWKWTDMSEAKNQANYYKDTYSPDFTLDNQRDYPRIKTDIVVNFYKAADDLISHFDLLKAEIGSINQFTDSDILDSIIKAGKFDSTRGSTYNEMGKLIDDIAHVCAHNKTDFSNYGNYDNTPDPPPSSGGTSAFSPVFGGGLSFSGCLDGPGYSNHCGPYEGHEEHCPQNNVGGPSYAGYRSSAWTAFETN